ncbi:MAG: hypothetical protein U1F43_17045 [Myxococcota bacterium]
MMRAHILLGWLGGSVTTAGLLVTAMAAADGDIKTDAVPTLMPYEGRLEHDGVAVDDDVSMTFRIYDGASLRWSEDRTVAVVGGRFAALLGDTSAASGATLSSVLQDADDLALEVVVHDAQDGDLVLEGRKRLAVRPYALLSHAGVGVRLGQQLIVETDRTVSADGSDAPFLVRDGDGHRLAIDGDEVDSASALQLNRASGLATKVGGALTVVGGSVTLAASSNGDGGAIASVSGGALELNPSGALGSQTNFGGPVTFNGDVSGLAASTNQDNSAAGCVTYDLGLTTGQLQQLCPSGTAMVGGIFGKNNDNTTKGLQFMRCCPISWNAR